MGLGEEVIHGRVFHKKYSKGRKSWKTTVLLHKLTRKKKGQKKRSGI